MCTINGMTFRAPPCMIRKLYFHVSEEMYNAPIKNYSAATSKFKCFLLNVYHFHKNFKSI